MSESDLILGLELGVLAIAPMILALLVWAFYRFTKRNHVWADITLKSGKLVRPKVLPDRGMLNTKWGSWQIDANSVAGLFKNRLLYRVAQGYPKAIVYERQRLLVEYTDKKTGQKVTEWQEVVNPLPVAPDENRISIHLKNHLFSDIYTNKAGLTLLLLVIAFLVVISILIQVVK